MRPLAEYINEAVKIVAKDQHYRLVTLVTHTGIDCKNLTKEQFSDLMYADLEQAQEEYGKLVYDERKKRIADRKRRNQEYNKKVADAKYKQQSKHDEYLQKLNFLNDQDTYYLNLNAHISFDFHLRSYGENTVNTDGISSSISQKKMDALFDEVSTSKWWEKGTGWMLTYTCKNDSLFPEPWGEIILLMDDKSTVEKKDADAALAKAISDYYKNSNGYTGD